MGGQCSVKWQRDPPQWKIAQILTEHNKHMAAWIQSVPLCMAEIDREWRSVCNVCDLKKISETHCGNTKWPTYAELQLWTLANTHWCNHLDKCLDLNCVLLNLMDQVLEDGNVVGHCPSCSAKLAKQTEVLHSPPGASTNASDFCYYDKFFDIWASL